MFIIVTIPESWMKMKLDVTLPHCRVSALSLSLWETGKLIYRPLGAYKEGRDT